MESSRAGAPARLRSLSVLGSIGVIFLATILAAQSKPAQIPLHNGWAIQSGCKVNASGEVISTPSFIARDWYQTTVPMTVVGVEGDDRLRQFQAQALAVLIGRALGSLDADIQPPGLIVLAVTGVVWIVVGIVAAYVPAARASSVNPLIALRYE